MKKIRLLSLILMFCFIINSNLAYALEYSSTNRNSYEYIVKDLGTGAYQTIDRTNKTNTPNLDEKSISIVHVKDDLYKTRDTTLLGKNELLLKVKDNIFQKVEKVELGNISVNNVEEKIAKYKVKDKVAEDLREIAETAERDNLETGATLYVPNAVTYYVGYMDYNYCDEVLYYYNRTPYL
ncbi:hypothetical protein [Sedimentibacter sp.]|uniref:hypothetical protein n=1 Tax=Sedimentibacter sp. TaxID=1960295 RepID=UPI0028A6BE0A|nr:hypothetical protein [Sedimentibacter sp.]